MSAYSLLMRLLLLTVTLLTALPLSAQHTAAPDSTLTGLHRYFRSSAGYAVNPLVSIPLIVGGGYASQQRLISLQDKPPLTTEELRGLDPEAVNGFDRIALRRSAETHKQAVIWSGNLFNTAQVTPFALFIWKKYRRDWFDITLMYLQAQVTQGLFYGYAPFGPTLVDRFRPRAYYDYFPDGERNDGNQRNSMFSGHVSTTSTGFYFAARMIDDYNPQFSGWQRALLYTGATLPSLLGGWWRIAGLKHYPTDVLIGLGVGAISGIGVPSVHKWWKQRHGRSRLTMQPLFGGGAGGLALSLRY